MGQVDSDLLLFSQYQQEPLDIPDCNTCMFVDRKENEEHIGHYCNRYNKRVFHRTSNLKHDSYIWPCRECTEDKHSCYMRPLTNKEAAEILEKIFVKIISCRQNGKTMTIFRCNEAMIKAIHLLRTTPDE